MRLLLLLLLFCASPALSQALDDPHLQTLPRAETEARRIATVTTPTTDFTKPEPYEAKSAGAATVRATTTADAFSAASANIPFAAEMDFKLGNGLFRKTWVAAPASTLASDGLGPLSNARACQDCHLKDGRGRVPAPSETAVSLFLRISIPGGTPPADIADYLATLPDPTYGHQIQTFAAPGHAAEGRMTITHTDLPITLADGTTVSLRAPAYTVTDPAYGSLHPQAMLSPRIAPQMIGLGLLEAIPARDILALADPDDANNDGISGRPNIVISAEFQTPMLGRFGHKSGSPTIREQSSSAFSGDMGLSTPLHPAPWGDCTTNQPKCINAPHGQKTGVRDGLEVDAKSMDLITFYAQNLGVPERRNVDDPAVLRGKEVFYTAQCAACHVPKHVTHRLDGQPEQSFQLIWPYTDLLLHDMGEGLADNRPEARATGTEWRTPPLWGIGLTAQVSGQTQFLHDGRAGSLLEAILWHGGEALAARDHVIALPKADRDALLLFLESL